MPTVIVDTQTNTFMPLGHAEDARYVKVTVPRNPDPVTEKYSGNPGDPIAAKTAQEIADYFAALSDADASATYETNKLIKAVAISYEAYRLGKNPAALTAGELNAAKTRIVNIYKAL